jgi:hypothetical protein
MKILTTVITALSIIQIGCVSPKSNYINRDFKETYLYSFKMTYFKQLLFIGFNRTNEIQTLLVQDRSGYGEPILTQQDISLIDSLVRIDNVKMSQDSILSIGTRSEGIQGKRVFDYSITKFNSKWLDSLAKAQYKYYKKINK